MFPSPDVPARAAFSRPAQEAFAINLGETFDLVNYVPDRGRQRAVRQGRRRLSGGITQDRANDDLIGKSNVTSFALELPIACLTGAGNGVIGAWSTASIPQSRVLDPSPTYSTPARNGGAFVQVSRLGMRW